MMNVSAATTTSRTGAIGADAGPVASGDTDPSAGQSPFQALLAPTIAAGDAAASELAAAGNAGAGLAFLDALAQQDVGAADADGNDLPAVPVPVPSGLLAGAAPTVAMRGGAASTNASGPLRSALGQTTTAGTGVDQPPVLLADGMPLNDSLDRFSTGPHRVPGAGLLDAASTVVVAPAPGNTPPARAVASESPGAEPALPIDPADGEAPDAILDRFGSGPHRLPATAIAAFGAAQLLKFGDVAGNAPTNAVADLARSAVDVGLSPAQAQATAGSNSTGSAVPAGFGQAPGSAAWGQALDQQVMLMLNRGAQEARIRLHPQELGQLDIRLSMGGDRVDLNFSVQHAAVAGALQQHMPQLTQMLADQGLSLGQASVSHDQAQSGSNAGQNGQAHGGNGSLATQTDAEIETSHLRYQPAERGLLDIFA